MYSTANMGLTSWDQQQDDFNHTQLNGNWVALDQHDHSNGRGVQVSTPGIAAQAITSPLIANGAVGNPQLAAGAVGTSNIQASAITTALIATGAVTSASIANGAVTFTDLDPNVISLGSVMLWYRGPGQATTPGGGWEIMDGRPWSSITNSLGLSAGNIPDMRGVFAQGADINAVVGPGIGVTGGSNTANLAHNHNVNPHTHSIAPHFHVINNDGSHMHLWQGGLHMASRTNSFAMGLFIEDAAIPPAFHQNTFYSMYIQNLLSNPTWFQKLPGGGTQQLNDGGADMDNAGIHNHGGVTQASPRYSTDPATGTTDTQLSNVSTVPANVGLLFIMRCR